MITSVETLNGVLEQLKLNAKVMSCQTEGPFLVVDLTLNPGGKYGQILKHSTEIALALKAVSEPLIYPVTRQGIIRMEVMVDDHETIWFNDSIKDELFTKSDKAIPLALGQLRSGSPLIIDLAKMPHLLIGGATGSGKSIMLHSIINSIILKNSAQLVLIDTKRVEFSYYDGIRRLFSPIVRDVDSAISIMEKLIIEMDVRFDKLEKAGVRNIETYSGKMPYIVVVIDELADIMAVSKKSFQDLVCRLAQKSRACGIHIVAATQRPSVDVVTGLIKANFTARISCKVTALVDSRTILDRSGAEKLLGKGDAIIDCVDLPFTRFKGSFLSEKDIVKYASQEKGWWNKLWNG